MLAVIIFQCLEDTVHALLDIGNSIKEPAVILMGSPLHVNCCFFLTTFGSFPQLAMLQLKLQYDMGDSPLVLWML